MYILFIPKSFFWKVKSLQI